MCTKASAQTDQTERALPLWVVLLMMVGSGIIGYIGAQFLS